MWNNTWSVRRRKRSIGSSAEMNARATICENLGKAMYDLAAELFPICRSATGPGVRETLSRLQQIVPLEIREVASGTPVFDWTVPREWCIRDAYVKDQDGHRVIDFRASNLHVVNGSAPVRATMSWHELKPHVHTLPEHPMWIPYRTSFHTDDWGFCVSFDDFKRLDNLGDRRYEVCVESTLKDGSLTFGELLLPGESDDEVLVSTHICHPSLANDNLSGITVATYFARSMQQQVRRYSYRFLFIPATIGAITWLSLNEANVRRIRHGWVMSVVGDPGAFTYKRTRRGNAEIDRAFTHVLRQSGESFAVHDFEPFGYDQRQFCSPGFNLPIGCLMRSPNGCFPEYHTSGDNLDLIKPESLAGALDLCLAVSDVVEGNRVYRNLNPRCEPRLGPRGLYQAFGSHSDRQLLQKAVLWVLNLSDGEHSLLEIADRSAIRFELIREAADLLLQHNLLAESIAVSSSPTSKPFETSRSCHEYCVL